MLVENQISILRIYYFCVSMENILSVTMVVPKPQWYEMRVHQMTN